MGKIIDNINDNQNIKEWISQWLSSISLKSKAINKKSCELLCQIVNSHKSDVICGD